MGKVWRSNSNLGSHSFLKSMFLTCGASKILGMHAQAIMHPWISFLTHPHGFLAPSRSTKRWSSLLHGLAIIYFDSPYSEYILGVSRVNGKEGAMILGFEEAIFSPVRNLGFLLHIFCIFLVFWKLGNSFLGCQWVGEETHEFWVLLSLFWPC